LHAVSGLPRLAERSQSLDERLERQLRTDEIDRTPDEDLETGVAGASRELGRQPGLPDARFSGDEDGRTVPRPVASSARPSSPSSSTRPTKALVGIPRLEDTALGCRR
jgi:hypothetical protein